MIAYSEITIERWAENPTTSKRGFVGEKVYNNPKRDPCSILIYKKKSSLVLAVENYAGENDDLPHTEGFFVEVKELNAEKLGIKSYIAITCTNPVYYSTFLWFAKEVCGKVLRQESTPKEAIFETIEIIKGFVQKPSEGVLDKKNQYGLLCELLVLEAFLKVRPNHAIAYWQKESNTEHDFICDNWRIEVKATLKRVHVHRINSLEQLVCPRGYKLAVVSYRLKEGKGISLQTKIDQLDRKFFSTRPQQKHAFYQLLRDRKYHIDHKDEYYQHEFELLSSRFYPIDANTPRITAESFKVQLPANINHVEYDLNFEGLAYRDLKQIHFSKIIS